MRSNENLRCQRGGPTVNQRQRGEPDTGINSDARVKVNSPPVRILVRPLWYQDIGDALKVVNGNLPVVYTSSYFENEFKKPTSRCFGAFTKENQLLGVIMGGFEDPNPPMPVLAEKFKLRPRQLFLIKVLAVDKNFRRLKIGRRLMEKMIDEANAMNAASYPRQIIEAIYLQVMCENLAALALYEKLGFQVMALVPQYYSTQPRRDAYIMLRRVEGPEARVQHRAMLPMSHARL